MPQTEQLWKPTEQSHILFTMSAMAKNRGDSNATLSFTLPISCQICLGKVKQPVICPNHHVFCKTCMELWLDHSQQCPSCRVAINADNPCRPILGGLAHQEQHEERFSCRELRKARVELLFKEYETELERLQSENEMLLLENKTFRERLKDHASSRGPTEGGGTHGADLTTLSRLTKKLDDATALYDKVKKDLSHFKQENAALKDENVTLQRTTHSLRLELHGRSPRKYGRTTVAVLENKVEAYEKEIKQLKKALERSDSYIEDIEAELEQYRKSKSGSHHSQSQKTVNRTSHKQGGLFAPPDADLSSILDPSFRTEKSDMMDDDSHEHKSTPSLSKNCNDTTFDLEAPSPFTAASFSKPLASQNSAGDNPSGAVMSRETFDDSEMSVGFTDAEKCRKKLRFGFQEKPSSSSWKGKELKDTSEDFERPDFAQPSKSSLNISMTPEIEDCMKLFDEAEKKIERRRGTPDSGKMGLRSTTSIMNTTQPSTNFAAATNPQASKHLNFNLNFSSSGYQPGSSLPAASSASHSSMFGQTQNFNTASVTRGQHRPPFSSTAPDFNFTSANVHFAQSQPAGSFIAPNVMTSNSGLFQTNTRFSEHLIAGLPPGNQSVPYSVAPSGVSTSNYAN